MQSNADAEQQPVGCCSFPPRPEGRGFSEQNLMKKPALGRFVVSGSWGRCYPAEVPDNIEFAGSRLRAIGSNACAAL